MVADSRLARGAIETHDIIDLVCNILQWYMEWRLI